MVSKQGAIKKFGEEIVSIPCDLIIWEKRRDGRAPYYSVVVQDFLNSN